MPLVTQAVFDELVHLVDPGVEPYKPKKGQPNIIMAVGLQVITSSIYHHTYSPRILGKWKDYHMHEIGCLLSETRL